ncbi:MAG: hypothetical protein RML45_11495 [Acetobacteraceae bacterium]|nr:hypothetical protein [Acetobacteraceae bacterium]
MTRRGPIRGVSNLRLMQRAAGPTRDEEGSVWAVLDHTPVGGDDDAIGVADRGQPMRDDEPRPRGCEFGKWREERAFVHLVGKGSDHADAPHGLLDAGVQAADASGLRTAELARQVVALTRGPHEYRKARTHRAWIAGLARLHHARRAARSAEPASRADLRRDPRRLVERHRL